MKTLLTVIFMMLIACENPSAKDNNVNKREDENMPYRSIHILDRDIADSFTMNETSLFVFHLIGIFKDYTVGGFTNESLDETTSVEWEINGDTFTESDQIGFTKHFLAGTYSIKVTLRVGEHTLTDELELIVTEHQGVVQNGFLNYEFGHFSGGVKFDQNDDLWVTSIFSGSSLRIPVLKYSNGQFTPYVSNATLPMYQTSYVDGDGTVWFNNYSRSYVAYVNSSNEFVPVQILNEPVGHDIHTILEDKDNPDLLLLGMHDGSINALNKTTMTIQAFNDQPGAKANHPHDMKYDAAGNLWVVSDVKTLMYDGNDWSEQCDIGDAKAILIDQNRVLIADYTNGLYIFENGEWTNFNPSNSNIPEGRIRSLQKDNNGTIYVGFSEFGLFTFVNNVFVALDQTSLYKDIHRITFDSNNKMAFAHSTGFAIQL